MPGATSILDTFNRADASTLGANWSLFTDFGIGGNDDFSIISNQAALGASGEFTTYDFLYWNNTIYGEDCEVYLTLSTAPTGAFALLARGKDAGSSSTVDGYYLDLQRSASPDSWRIYRFDNGVATQLGATVSQNVSNGNTMLFECIGSTLKGYLNTGSGYSQIISRSDSTYPHAGWLGFYGDGNDTGWRYDNFGGGGLASGIVHAPNLRTTVSGEPYHELWLTTDTGQRIAQLSTGLGFEATRVDGGMGWFSYRPPASFNDSLFQPDRMLQYWYQPPGSSLYLWNVYFLRRIEFSTSGSNQSIVISGPDVKDLLRRRIVAAYAASAAASKSDLIDDMMKEIVTQSIADGVAPTPTAGTRVWSNLSIQSDASDGPSTTKEFSFDKLLDESGGGLLPALQKDSREKGTEVFFDIVPNSVSQTGITFQFRTTIGQPGQDVTSKVVFDQRSGNLKDIRLVYDYASEENYIYAAGQGEKSERNVQQRYDTERYGQSIWGRMEGHADARTQGSNAGVQAAGDSKLSEGRPKIRFSATPVDTEGTRFGVHWDFGYKVRAAYRNRLFDAIIRAAAIGVDASGRTSIRTRLDYEGLLDG